MAKTSKNTCLLAPQKVRALIPEFHVRKVATAANVGYEKLNLWLKGEGGFAYDELFRVARLFEVTTDYLLDDTQRTLPGAEHENVRFVRSRLTGKSADDLSTDSKTVDVKKVRR